MQSNDKTIHAPIFVMTKAADLRANFEVFCQQVMGIIQDLGLRCNLKYVDKQTKAGPRIRAEFVFANDYENIMRLIDTLDLRYAPKKAAEARFMRLYHEAKKAEYERMQRIYEEVMAEQIPARDIARKHGINESQVYNWRRRRTGVRIPNTFPTYTEFKQKLLSPA